MSAALSVAALALLGSGAAQAQTLVYSNIDIDNFQGFAYQPAGAATNGSITSTTTVMDDIELADTSNLLIGSMQFNLFNFASTEITAAPVISFWAEDADGLPTTLIQSLISAPVSFAAESPTNLTYTPGNVIFTAPSNGRFLVGITFTNIGVSTTTDEQLNQLALEVFDPPTVGSSQDQFYQTTDAGVYNTSNPAGDLTYFGGTPAANFGFAFSTFAPEPSSAALALVGAVTAGLPILARRRRRSLRRDS